MFGNQYGVRTVTLNRPKKLNSLNGSMARKIVPRLQEWKKSQLANVVVIKGEGRALCAGGDVAALAQANQSGKEGQQSSKDYFALEYKLDHLIATYPKPYVAFMDGIVLGGGMGVSAHGSHRVATERTRAGMPETAIGFTPDVGGSFHLARAPFQAGRHLAATSAHASGSDAVALGLADIFVESARLDELEQALASPNGGIEVVEARVGRTDRRALDERIRALRP